MLLNALQDNIDKFEKRFGEINIEGQATPKFGFPTFNKDEKVNASESRKIHIINLP